MSDVVVRSGETGEVREATGKARVRHERPTLLSPKRVLRTLEALGFEVSEEEFYGTYSSLDRPGKGKKALTESQIVALAKFKSHGDVKRVAAEMGVCRATALEYIAKFMLRS